MALYQFLAVVLLQQGSLVDIEKRAEELHKVRNWSPTVDQQRTQLNQDLIKLLDSNGIHAADDFNRAAKAVQLGRAGFDESRLAYELTVSAMALGNAEAAKRIKLSWDMFLMSTGRHQHLGSIKGFEELDAEKFVVQATVGSVQTVLNDPEKARADAGKLQRNPEIKTLVEEDQKIRQSDWSKMTAAQMMEMSKGDSQRRAKLKSMLKSIKLMTAQDYQDAALVMQHGSWFDDYALAHELSLCATILDPKVGRQMVALSYDRMLVSAGYKQRVGTQYHGVTLTEVDSKGFSDEMRKALGRKPLAEVPKTFGGG